MKPDETIKTIELASQGHSQRFIGNQISTSAATINREVNKPEIATLIKELAQSYIAESIPKIIDRHKAEINNASQLQAKLHNSLLNETELKNPDLISRELARVDNKDSRLLQATGLHATNNTAPVYQQFNIYSDNSHTINNNVLALIQGKIDDIN